MVGSHARVQRRFSLARGPISNRRYPASKDPKVVCKDSQIGGTKVERTIAIFVPPPLINVVAHFVHTFGHRATCHTLIIDIVFLYKGDVRADYENSTRTECDDSEGQENTFIAKQVATYKL